MRRQDSWITGVEVGQEVSYLHEPHACNEESSPSSKHSYQITIQENI